MKHFLKKYIKIILEDVELKHVLSQKLRDNYREKNDYIDVVGNIKLAKEFATYDKGAENIDNHFFNPSGEEGCQTYDQDDLSLFEVIDDFMSTIERRKELGSESVITFLNNAMIKREKGKRKNINMHKDIPKPSKEYLKLAENNFYLAFAMEYFDLYFSKKNCLENGADYPKLIIFLESRSAV